MRNLNQKSHDDGDLEIEITNTQTVVNKYTYGYIWRNLLSKFKNIQKYSNPST